MRVASMLCSVSPIGIGSLFSNCTVMECWVWLCLASLPSPSYSLSTARIPWPCYHVVCVSVPRWPRGGPHHWKMWNLWVLPDTIHRHIHYMNSAHLPDICQHILTAVPPPHPLCAHTHTHAHTHAHSTDAHMLQHSPTAKPYKRDCHTH